MTQPRRCPQCDAELPPDAPDGVCPKCLMQLGFESRGEMRSDEQAGDPTVVGSGFVAPAPEDLAKHFPQLEVLELLGKGGMGAVYKARQPKLDRFVALKILPPEVGKDPAFTERFSREARALAMLNHPCIVAVYDFGQTAALQPLSADGKGATSEGPLYYYFVMEYVDGANLRQMIESGRLKPEEALAIVPQICDALQFAHDEGVVHRDIKPENVLIDKRGRVKIADFGLAKLLGADAENSLAEKPFSLTGTHQVMGTLQYMAPEQMRGSHDVDHRADIYSLGVVFYEMLTGELPIGRFEPPSKKVQIDVRLDEVVLRSLEADPDRRYQRASDVKSEVESIVTAASTRPPDVQPDTTADDALVRGRLKVPAIGLLVAGIVNLLATLSIVLIPVFMTLLKDGQLIGIPGAAELAIVVCSLAMGTMLIAGAVRMFDMQSHRIALIAAIIAVLPCTLGFLISLPFGIWALIVLSKQDVKNAFIGHGQPPQPPAVGLEAGFIKAATGREIAPTAALPERPAVTQPSGESLLVAPRYSRKAIFGAAWAPFFFMATLSYFTVAAVRVSVPQDESGNRPAYSEVTRRVSSDGLIVEERVSPVVDPDQSSKSSVRERNSSANRTDEFGPAWWQWVLICTILPLGFTAPFGTTVLGIIAISDVRHSQGRLAGLSLAVVDALFFPLLILDGLIIGVVLMLVNLGINLLETTTATPFPRNMSSIGLAFALAVLISVVVDFLICRSVWRKASGPFHETTDSKTPGSAVEGDAVKRQLKGPGIGLVVTGIANWLVLPFLIAIASYLATSSPGSGPPATVLGGIAAAIFVVSVLLIFAGLKIMRCESRRWGIVGAVLAMIVNPVNVIGLPIGIWALVVLSSREVKEAFKQKEAGSGTGRSSTRFRAWGVLLAVLAIGAVIGVGTAAHLSNANSGNNTRDEIEFVVRPQDGHLIFAFDDVTLVFEGTQDVDPSSESRGKMPVRGGTKLTIEMSGRTVSSTGETGPPGINTVTVNGYTFQLAKNCTQLWPPSPIGSAPLYLDRINRPLTIWIAKDGTHRLRKTEKPKEKAL